MTLSITKQLIQNWLRIRLHLDAQIKIFANDAADMYCEGEFSTVDEALAFIKKETKKAFDLK